MFMIYEKHADMPEYAISISDATIYYCEKNWIHLALISIMYICGKQENRISVIAVVGKNLVIEREEEEKNIEKKEDDV